MSKYRFDQIAINSTAKKKPTEEDKYHYIGLEHIDSQNLIVSRWGSEVPPQGEKLLMEKGDVLFGKRRAYQKKVAIAPFDGIFSAHGMVLRPNGKVIDKDFFPMFISSDYFLDTAIAISVGSLSPTINWKDLARLEFDLPPMEEQRKLAEVLWSINDTLQAYQNLLAETDALVQTQFVEMFGLQHKNATFIRLEECCKKISGGSTPSMKHPEYYGGTMPFVKSGDIKSSIVDSGSLWLTEKALEETRVRLVPKGAVIIVIRSAILQRELPLAVSTKSFAINQDLKALEPKEEFDSFYLYWAIKSKENELLKNVQSMLTSHLDLQTILNIPIMDVPLKKQLVFRAFVEQGDKSKSTLQNTITALQATKRRILEDALGTGRKE